MKSILAVAAVSLSLVFVLNSCSKGSQTNNNNTIDCNPASPKSYVADVNPIVQATCNQSGCHNVGSVNGPGPITNYTQVFNARVSIREAIRTGLMPQNTTLTLAQKTAIICWIDSGAQNN
jgi:hypothetical protein